MHIGGVPKIRWVNLIVGPFLLSTISNILVVSTNKEISFKVQPSWEVESYSLVNKFPVFIEHKVSSTYSQKPAMDHILSQMNPAHTLQTYFPLIRFNVIPPYTSRSSEWSLPFRLSNQNFVPISYLSHALQKSIRNIKSVSINVTWNIVWYVVHLTKQWIIGL
jgi:hypothetical protein